MAGNLPKTTDKPDQALNDVQSTTKPKKSLYQRYMDAKTGRNVQISDEDMVKYTGMTKAEMQEWAKDRPGVAGNQPAGKLAMGSATGFGGYETSKGYGGWGPGAEGELKFPPKPATDRKSKNLDDEDEEGKEREEVDGKLND
ncbi:hypothetical protein NEMBOFW57_004876 [Staphylotrichum longicolle]|uniref:Uncharacterized protein n=1 Tax=Staphylotrichum longicolle TaxID=669026 RepID=A0AAD4EVR6_9PEZI|nr:hypothetical protein NEMBOFW57_004876 [Staphylotrichum longicolle]